MSTILDDMINSKEYHTALPKKSGKALKCGEWNAFFDAAEGRQKPFVHHCNDFRNCQFCMNERKEQKLKKLEETHRHSGGGIYECVVSEKEYKRLRRKYGSENVVRFPTEEDTHVFICAKESDIDFDDADYFVKTSIFDLKQNDQYLEYLCSTPPRMSISGGYREPKPEQPTKYVEVRYVVYNVGTQEHVIQLSQMAVDRTAYLNPDEHSLQEAINERQRAFENAAKEIGVKLGLIAEAKTTRVDVEKINWQIQLE